MKELTKASEQLGAVFHTKSS